jgi:hypothetical protein
MADVDKTTQAVPEAGHGEEFEFERQEPKNNLIALLLISSCVVLVIIVVLLQWFYDFTKNLKASATQNVQFEQVERLRADEQEKLTKYKNVDPANGVVQIPVERAMQLMVEEAKAGQLKYAQAIQGGAAGAAAGGPAASPSPAASPGAAKAAGAQSGSSATSKAAAQTTGERKQQ